MRTVAFRKRAALALILLAWFAQLCLPLAHAATMANARAEMPGWCGEPSRALAFAAQLPDEIREALGFERLNTDHLDGCAQLCAAGSAPQAPNVASTAVLRAAGLEPAPVAQQAAPRACERMLMPPSQGPPTHA
jgi:hypothetical protein